MIIQYPIGGAREPGICGGGYSPEIIFWVGKKDSVKRFIRLNLYVWSV